MTLETVELVVGFVHQPKFVLMESVLPFVHHRFLNVEMLVLTWKRTSTTVGNVVKSVAPTRFVYPVCAKGFVKMSKRSVWMFVSICK